MPVLTRHARENRCGATATQRGAEVAAQRKRVLLADDNEAVLHIVEDLLEPEFAVVGAVTDGKAVLAHAASLKPDIVVLDISMGEPDGIVIARQLRSAYQHIRIVFLTVHELAEFIRSALAAGATAYVFKSRLLTDLVPALHAACTGKLFVSCQSS